MTVGDVFELAIEIDMTKIAHRTFWALSKGHVTANCPADKLHEIDYHAEEIESMINSNLLNIEKVKVFVVQTNYPNTFAFYFAENSLDAHALHQRLFREKPRNITMSNRLLISGFEYAVGPLPTKGKLTAGLPEVKAMHELRREVVAYPYYVGHAKAESHVLHRLEA